MEEEKIVKDNEGYFREEKVSYRDIILRQFQKVVTNSSKEMKKGFYVDSFPAGVGGPTVVTRYVGDTRYELIQSIDALHDILQPKFDKDMKEKSEEILPKIKKIKNYEGDSISKGKIWRMVLVRYRQLFQHICFFLERQSWFVTEETTD